jgi:beta-fructofuranosidase
MFYRPEDGWVGDLIPYYDGNEFRLFYLKTRREGEHFSDVAWNMVSTKDFIHFHDDLPTGIDGGTGSVIFADGMYHMFYCDNSRLEKQLICHATSPDLFNWSKVPEDTFEADNSIYELPNWRDPHVFWNDEKKNTGCSLPPGRKGDQPFRLYWPLYLQGFKKMGVSTTFLCPRIDVGTHECPDIFNIGDCGIWSILLTLVFMRRYTA